MGRPCADVYCCPIYLIPVDIELRRIEVAVGIDKDYFFFHGAVVRPRLFHSCMPPRYHLSLWAG